MVPVLCLLLAAAPVAQAPPTAPAAPAAAAAATPTPPAPAAEQIASAVLAAPADRRTGAGVLGYDLFRRAIVSLEGAQGIAIAAPGDDGDDGDDGWSPLLFEEGLPVIAARYPGPDGPREGLFAIDTGSAIANGAFGEDGRTLFLAAHYRLARVRTRTRGHHLDPRAATP